MDVKARAKAAEERKLRQAALKSNPESTFLGDNPEHLDPEDPEDNPDLNIDDLDDGLDLLPEDPEEPDYDPQEELRLEIQRLEQELNAHKGRVAPAQRQAEEYRRLWESERLTLEQERAKMNAQMAEMQQKLMQRNTRQAAIEAIPEELREDMDPELLEGMIKVASAVAQAQTPQLDVSSEVQREFQRREEQQVTDLRRAVLTEQKYGLSDLQILAERPDFQEWSAQEENDDFDVMVRSLLSAKTTGEVEKYARAVKRRVEKFKSSSKPASRRKRTDTKTSHLNRMQRGRRGSELTDRQRGAALREVKALSRSKNMTDRQKATDILNQFL